MSTFKHKCTDIFCLLAHGEKVLGLDSGPSFKATPPCVSASTDNECLDSQSHRVRAVSLSSRAGWHQIPVSAEAQTFLAAPPAG